MPLSFANKFCARFQVAPRNFRKLALARTLYPHARWLRPLIESVDADFFAADRDFISDIAYLQSRESFGEAMWDFQSHEDNRRFLRRWLYLRISVGRAERLVVEACLDRGATPAPANIRRPGSASIVRHKESPLVTARS